MYYSKNILLIAIILIVGLLTTINAQEAKSNKEEVALNSYCPVAYAAMQQAVEGKKEFSSNYKGKEYYFANEQAKKMFDANPEKFIPKYDGYCATAAAMGKEVKSDPMLFTVYKGSTYLFSNEKAKEMFDANPDKIIEQADKNFKSNE